MLRALKNRLFPSPDPATTPLLPGTCPRKNCPNAAPLPTPAPSTAGTSSSANPRTISDAIIGLSDGLTVPFALTAGLSAFNDTRVVLYGGFAELIAGSISMGLGGWLAGRGEAEFQQRTQTQTETCILHQPALARNQISDTLQSYGLQPEAAIAAADALVAKPVEAVEFVMRFCEGVDADTGRTPVRSAATIAAGYFIGGFIPLLPYFFVGREEVLVGLWWSVGVMAGCLFVFGVGRGWVLGEGRQGWQLVRGGVEMILVGGVAAGASWGIVRALGSAEG